MKTVDATISFVDGFAFEYRNDHLFGKFLGVIELGHTMLWLCWSMAVTIVAFVLAAYIEEQLRYREEKANEVGLGKYGIPMGAAVTMDTAIKFVTLEMILALGVWISGWTIADTADELLGWFDKYAIHTDDEGTDKRTGERDVDPTSMIYDIVFHVVTAMYSFIVLTSIMVGGYVFAFIFAQFPGPIPNCDLSEAEIETYSKDGESFVDKLIPELGQGTLEECKANMKYMFNAIDVGGDGYLDKCDDAKFLKASGAPDEYALTFGGSATLYELQNYCYQIVPDAFDQQPDMFEEIMMMVYKYITSLAGGDSHDHDMHDDDSKTDDKTTDDTNTA